MTADLSISALFLGLAGSLHCVGMCGPLAMAVPGLGQSRMAVLAGGLLYNGGRVITYTILGGIMGLAGQSFAWAGLQREISIVLGVLLILLAFFSISLDSRLARTRAGRWLRDRISKVLARYFRGTPTKRSIITIGMLNGALPCGMVYTALSASLTAGGVLNGMGYMAIFGLGTLPLMTTLLVARDWVGLSFRRRMTALIPYALVFAGVWMIFRGVFIVPGLMAHSGPYCG